MNYSYSISKIGSEEARAAVISFFEGSQELADLFEKMADTVRETDRSVVFRTNGEIIGVSQKASVFHFYISKDAAGGFAVKFRHAGEREALDPRNEDRYRDLCREAAGLILQDPRYRAGALGRTEEEKAAEQAQKRAERLARAQKLLGYASSFRDGADPLTGELLPDGKLELLRDPAMKDLIDYLCYSLPRSIRSLSQSGRA